MRNLSRYLQKAFLCLLFIPSLVIATEKAPGFECPDEQIKEDIIKESIKNYQGSCPCPYSVDAKGQPCGDQSAYSMKGIKAAYCYSSDITDEMVQEKCKDYVL